MSKGKKGIGLDKPCPKCGKEVPASYQSPLQDGLCGKCTDEMIKSNLPKLPNSPVNPQRPLLVRVIPGGGSTIIGFALGLGFGVLVCVGCAVFVPGFWADVIGGLGGMLGK
jgi:hypothetical protein